MHKRPLQERQGDGPLEYRARFRHSVIAGLALREKQIQQNYRPIIAVHKCLARRPGPFFRALSLAAFGNRPVRRGLFEPNGIPGLKVADPFMGWWHDGVPSQPDGKDAAAAVNWVEVRR